MRSIRFFLACMIGIMLTACNAGCHFSSTPDEASTELRTVEDEYDAAVKIETSCAGIVVAYGSGVIVSSTQVLTASHVVDHPGCSWMVRTRDGDVHPMELDLSTETFTIGAMPPDGIARLTMAQLEIFDEWTTAPVLGYVPDLGDELCIVTAWPDRNRKCGEVQPWRDGVAQHLAVTEPGNSGSAAYDRAGRLVGIVVTLSMSMANGQITGGGVAPIELVRWIVPGAL